MGDLADEDADLTQFLASRDERIYEVVGRPVDLDEIVNAVKEALKARATR